jgi:DNA polymerase
LLISKEEATIIVSAWRDANSMTRQFWWDLDAAAKNAIRYPTTTMTVRGIQIKTTHSGGRRVLLIKLPSGRCLWYRNPRLEPDATKPQYDSIVYDGVDQYTKKWTGIRTWGAKLAENITQAVARDIIIEAALRTNLPLVLSVHDELLFEVPGSGAEVSFAHALKVIETAPAWAPGLPVKAEGAILDRYGKG